MYRKVDGDSTVLQKVKDGDLPPPLSLYKKDVRNIEVKLRMLTAADLTAPMGFAIPSVDSVSLTMQGKKQLMDDLKT